MGCTAQLPKAKGPYQQQAPNLPNRKIYTSPNVHRVVTPPKPSDNRLSAYKRSSVTNYKSQVTEKPVASQMVMNKRTVTSSKENNWKHLAIRSLAV